MTGLILPTAVGGTATGWTLTDYVEPQARTAAAAGGAALAQFRQLEPDELWLIDHAVVACTSSTPTSLRLYADAPEPLRLLDGSNSSGNFDVADWPNGLQLAPSTSLVAMWVGADDGAIGTIRLQVRVLRRR